MTKYRYRPERLSDLRLTDYMEKVIREHAQEQINDDFSDFGFNPVPKLSCGMVRIIIEAAMIEYPELFKEAIKHTHSVPLPDPYPREEPNGDGQ